MPRLCLSLAMDPIPPGPWLLFSTKHFQESLLPLSFPVLLQGFGVPSVLMSRLLCMAASALPLSSCLRSFNRFSRPSSMLRTER